MTVIARIQFTNSEEPTDFYADKVIFTAQYDRDNLLVNHLISIESNEGSIYRLNPQHVVFSEMFADEGETLFRDVYGKSTTYTSTSGRIQDEVASQP